MPQIALIPHAVSSRRFTLLLPIPDCEFDAASERAQDFMLRKVARRTSEDRHVGFGKVGDGTTKLELSDVHRVFRPLAPEKGDVVHA